MYFVYILASESNGQYYYGFTSKDVYERVNEHNQGKSFHTKKYIPWKFTWYAAFPSKILAMSFEKYLKTGSGHAFSRKRLLDRR